MRLIQLEPNQRHVLTRLFEKHRRKRILIDGILHGYHGTAFADSSTDPQVAQLMLSPYALFGGDPNHPFARKLMRNLPKHTGTWIVPETDVWQNMILSEHGTDLQTRQRIDFSGETLNINHLRESKRHIPQRFEIKQVDLGLARRIISDTDRDGLGPRIVCFSSPQNFVEQGIGFCATSRNRIVCIALSYSRSHTGIDIQIYTSPHFRRKGLAASVAATLIVHCLESGIQPHWSAFTPISAKLAEKLGYVQEEAYNQFLIPRISKAPTP